MKFPEDLLRSLADAAGDDPNAIVTISHKTDDTKWMQLLPDKINVSYPFDDPPADRLAELQLPHRDLLEPGFWDIGLFADFGTEGLTSVELGEFIAAYLRIVFNDENPDVYEVDVGSAVRGSFEFDDAKELLGELLRLEGDDELRQ